MRTIIDRIKKGDRIKAITRRGTVYEGNLISLFPFKIVNAIMITRNGRRVSYRSVAIKSANIKEVRLIEE